MDGNSENRKLEERITRLEQKVRDLEQVVRNDRQISEEIEENSPAKEPESPKVIFEESFHEHEPKSWVSDNYSYGENWLNWLGIGLLLLGIAFLFKYSIDQGWLVPPVRSAFGLTVGLGLFVTGLQIDEAKSTFRQILLGGGIAAFYITGFATFQLYSFISYPVVWVFMIVVTLLALSLSLQQNEPVLSVIGTVGGLGTPFMLYRGEGSLIMLILYTCLILTGSGLIYLFRGWKSLLWTTVAGGWLVLMVGLITNIFDAIDPALSEQWALQAGVLFSSVIFWIVPVIREILSRRNPVNWPDPAFVNTKDFVDEHTFFVANPNVQALAVITPIATLFYSMGIWSVSNELWGAIALAGALVLGYTYLPLQNEGLKKLSMVHGFTALILITVSLFLLLEGEILLIALSLEAFVLRVITAKTKDVNISISSHILFGITGIWLLNRFLNPADAGGTELVLLNLDALTELFIIGIAGLAVPGYFQNKNSKLIYRLMAHIGLLAWFLKELSVLEDGQAYVTIAWGIYALIVLFTGFWKDLVRLRFIGMATIFVVVGKLFLVDLSQIQTILRILLFIGFGTLFLAAGYFLQTRWGELFSGPETEEPKQEFDP